MTTQPTKPSDKPPALTKRDKPLSAPVRKAIRLMFQDDHTQASAADAAGISREWLNKSLKTDRAQAYIREFTKRLRTAELLPASHKTVKRSIEKGDGDLAVMVLKEEGVVSHPRGTSQGASLGGPGGIQLNIVIAPQHAGSDLPHVVSGTVIEADSPDYGESEDDESE